MLEQLLMLLTDLQLLVLKRAHDGIVERNGAIPFGVYKSLVARGLLREIDGYKYVITPEGDREIEYYIC